jgi:hypothetical protein
MLDPHLAYPSHSVLLKRDRRAKAFESFEQETVHGVGAGEPRGVG